MKRSEKEKKTALYMESSNSTSMDINSYEWNLVRDKIRFCLINHISKAQTVVYLRTEEEKQKILIDFYSIKWNFRHSFLILSLS